MRLTLAGFLLLLSVLSLGCGKAPEVSDADEPTTDTIREAVAAAKPLAPIDTGLQPDPAYPIPDLQPKGLLGYLNQLTTMDPRGETDEEYIADQISRARSRLIAADRIILAQGVDDDLMVAAVEAKLDALKMLAIMDPNGLGAHFSPFVEALNESDSSKFARLGRMSLFWFETDRLSYGQQTTPDPLLQQLQVLLEHPDAGEAEFLAAQDASYVLNERGFQNECTDVLKLLGSRFADHDALGDEAKELSEKTAFREKVIAAMGGDKTNIEALFHAIQDLLADQEKLDAETLDNTLNAGQVLEYNGHFEDARAVFEAIRSAYEKCENKSHAQQAKLLVEFAEKRLGVIGKEIMIEGVHVDGTAFHWQKYRGKVVLVDFWASTSSPWLAELPSIKSTYDRFHDDGFEVVGVNVDRVQDNAFNYLRTARLPWPIVIDEVASGIDSNPNAIRYGVRAVPFLMLVDRDGKVADIHVRGVKLSDRVEELLNAPSTENARQETESVTR